MRNIGHIQCESAIRIILFKVSFYTDKCKEFAISLIKPLYTDIVALGLYTPRIKL
jgi:hypothetical protein